MPRMQRTKPNDEPLRARFIINGKDWDDHTDEEKDRVRAYAAQVALDVSLRPLKQRYGAARLAAALNAVLNLWKAEQAGQSPPFLMPLMERGVPPFVVAHMVEAVLVAVDSKHGQEETVAEPPRYVI